MPSNITTQSDLLRTVYRKYLRQLFNLKSILLQRLQRDTETWAQGIGISIPLHWEGTGGFGWSSSGKLPAAGEQIPKRALFNYGSLYGRIRLSGQFMRRAREGYASETRPMQWEMRKMVEQIRAGLNKDLYGAGTGILATIVSAQNATTLTVLDARGLKSNDIVDVIKTADGSVAGGIKGAAITIQAKLKRIVLKADQFIDWTDIRDNPTTYAVYRQNSRNQAMMGLDGIVSESNPASGNYGGIDRSVVGNEPWHGIVEGNSGVLRRLTFKLMQDTLDRVEQDSEGETSIVICHPKVWSVVADGLVAQKLYGGNLMKLNGWATAVGFGDLPIVKDKHCPVNSMYLLDESYLTIYQDSEGNWLEEDGNLLRMVPGEDQYEAAWGRDLQLICTAPNAQARIDDIDPAQAVG